MKLQSPDTIDFLTSEVNCTLNSCGIHSRNRNFSALCRLLLKETLATHPVLPMPYLARAMHKAGLPYIEGDKLTRLASVIPSMNALVYRLKIREAVRSVYSGIPENFVLDMGVLHGTLRPSSSIIFDSFDSLEYAIHLNTECRGFEKDSAIVTFQKDFI